MEQAPIRGPQSCMRTIPFKIPHISLLCTVRDREIWISVEFTKIFPKTFNAMKQFEWIGTTPNKYQPPQEDSDDKSPSFLQHLHQYATIDRRISRLRVAGGCAVVHGSVVAQSRVVIDVMMVKIAESEKPTVTLSLNPSNCQLSLFKPLCFFIDTYLVSYIMLVISL